MKSLRKLWPAAPPGAAGARSASDAGAGATGAAGYPAPAAPPVTAAAAAAGGEGYDRSPREKSESLETLLSRCLRVRGEEQVAELGALLNMISRSRRSAARLLSALAATDTAAALAAALALAAASRGVGGRARGAVVAARLVAMLHEALAAEEHAGNVNSTNAQVVKAATTGTAGPIAQAVCLHAQSAEVVVAGTTALITSLREDADGRVLAAILGSGLCESLPPALQALRGPQAADAQAAACFLLLRLLALPAAAEAFAPQEARLRLLEAGLQVVQANLQSQETQAAGLRLIEGLTARPDGMAKTWELIGRAKKADVFDALVGCLLVRGDGNLGAAEVALPLFEAWLELELNSTAAAPLARPPAATPTETSLAVAEVAEAPDADGEWLLRLSSWASAACLRSQAQRAADTALMASPPGTKTHLACSSLLALETGEAKRAAELAHNALDLDDSWAPGWRCLGSAEAKQGRQGAAVRALTRSLELETDHVRACEVNASMQESLLRMAAEWAEQEAHLRAGALKAHMKSEKRRKSSRSSSASGRKAEARSTSRPRPLPE
eukprot:TRINITY_DN71658_c0_g1_i1.p1 TRINITY_DN71658_c0_g1~~TRINITY_DN71658_c0_g1_i1.p1  ORF type:complete len:557 (-),score=149.66 TRINITY_DN71658_c0_g1_i1:152-1822(-)